MIDLWSSFLNIESDLKVVCLTKKRRENSPLKDIRFYVDTFEMFHLPRIIFFTAGLNKKQWAYHKSW